MLLLLSWEGSGIFSAIIILFLILKLLWDRLSKEDILSFALYILPSLTGAFSLTRTYFFLKPFALLAWGFPIWFLLTCLLHLLIRRFKVMTHLPMGLLSLGAGVFLISLALLMLSLIAPSLTSNRLLLLWENFTSPLGRDRLNKTISELYFPSAFDWISWYGIAFLAFSNGTLLSLYRICKSIGLNIWLSLSVWEIFLIGVIYTRFPMPERVSQAIYISSITLIILFLILSRIRSDVEGEGIPDAYLLALCWFSVMLLIARGAQRWHFFLAPSALIFTSFAFIEAFRAIRSHLRSPYIKIPLLICVCIALGFLIVSNGRAGFRVIGTSRPLLSPEWREAMEWMRDNLPDDAVVAAWWHYGSMINVLAHKGTVVDEDHFIPYWIHLMSRHLFCAQSEREALEFLKTHHVTHLLLSYREVENLYWISWIGSDRNEDRLCSLGILLRQPAGEKKLYFSQSEGSSDRRSPGNRGRFYTRCSLLMTDVSVPVMGETGGG